MKSKPKKILVSAEYRRITHIKDPLAALDECRSAINQLERGYWPRRRTYLGVLAWNAERISATRRTWRAFARKKFWKNCVGEKPRTKDRSKPLSFVVRYGENAVTRQAYKMAWRYTEVLTYLVELGVEPKAMAIYLAKPGQGINATYKRRCRKRGRAQRKSRTRARRKPARHL